MRKKLVSRIPISSKFLVKTSAAICANVTFSAQPFTSKAANDRWRAVNVALASLRGCDSLVSSVLVAVTYAYPPEQQERVILCPEVMAIHMNKAWSSTPQQKHQEKTIRQALVTCFY